MTTTSKSLQDTLDMMLAAGFDDERVAELREKLLIHALDGPPDPPVTPPPVRNAQEEIINLCESDSEESDKEDAMEEQAKEKKVDIKVRIKRNNVMEATEKAGLLSKTEKNEDEAPHKTR